MAKTTPATKATKVRNTLIATEKSVLPQGAPDQQTEADKMAEADKVRVFVPKGYNLTLDDGTIVPIPAGTQNMPRPMAEHWYSEANGLQVEKE